MPESKSHRTTANRLAKKFNTEYNAGKGPDIKTDKIVVEVETENTVKGGLRQLQGYTKRVYLSGTNEKALQKALEITQGTTVGVMNNQGKIIKRSTRRK